MKYPIGIQDFEKLRRGGFVYVDKTEFVYKLADSGCYYFLSRPRRFGKSLLLSTVKAYFEGKKKLFAGLAIEQLEQDWTEYPVLYLDLNAEDYSVESSLEGALRRHLSLWEKTYGEDDIETSLPGRFLNVIRRAYEQTGKKVVVLIDEYDKPMLEAIGNPELQEKCRNTLRGFYSVLKTMDSCIRFAMLTGVTKLGKMSVFSGLNNLKDISMDSRFATICGITVKEIDKYFAEEAEELAEAMGVSMEETRRRLRERFNGYHFCEYAEGVYNPFSLLNTLDSRKIRDYWFETGTPLFLVKLLQGSDYRLANLRNAKVTMRELGSIDAMYRNPVPVIYQSGYLTITGYDEEFQTYQLGFPNKEVEEGFLEYLLPFYISATGDTTEFGIDNFVEEVRRGNAEGFMSLLQTMFATSSYKVAGDREKYFQNSVNTFFTVMGFRTQVEVATSRGSIDMVVKTKGYIYIMEFKLDGSAEEALKQIEDKEYALPYSADGRKIFKIGVNFSGDTRNITDWKIAEN